MAMDIDFIKQTLAPLQREIELVLAVIFGMIVILLICGAAGKQIDEINKKKSAARYRNSSFPDHGESIWPKESRDEIDEDSPEEKPSSTKSSFRSHGGGLWPKELRDSIDKSLPERPSGKKDSFLSHGGSLCRNKELCDSINASLPERPSGKKDSFLSHGGSLCPNKEIRDSINESRRKKKSK